MYSAINPPDGVSPHFDTTPPGPPIGLPTASSSLIGEGDARDVTRFRVAPHISKTRKIAGLITIVAVCALLIYALYRVGTCLR
jgi:hypothetical protein